MKVATGIYRIHTCYPALERIPLAGYLIVGTSRIVLIDALIPEAIRLNVGSFMPRLGLTVQDIDTVIVTHGHPDHCGGLSTLTLARPDLEILCGEADRCWVEDYSLMFDQLFLRFPGALEDVDTVRQHVLHQMCGTPTMVTGTVQHGDVLDLGNTSLRIIDASGHSPGHIAVFDQRARALFTGDSVQGRGISFVDRAAALPPMIEDTRSYIATQRRLLTCRPQYLLSAHHDLKSTTEAETFLKLSAQIAADGESLVAEILRASDRPMSLRATVDEFRRRLNESEAEDFVGDVQFHVTVAAHLTSLISAAQVIEDEPGLWRHA